ncbi:MULTISPECIES: DUF397 domain-containing protein [unclassified Streptosporangium]|uniref:DUF397 domain-containing protein n=1 Tax=unclassified Streptosporangium TaxID=2632669 RepID=UPI002E2C965F|nr:MULTISPECIES: DUF397 domain-containing protein [unclassified Streptosporangium]
MIDSTPVSVEAKLSATVWRKSSRSNASGDCVEIARLNNNRVGVRDSKNPNGPALVFEATAFATFLEAVKAEQL